MSKFQGDFLGFSLGDIHSSTLNITRVSSNNRYEDNLIPSFKDTTLPVPGGDGTYYLDSLNNQRVFSIDFAYDNVHDEDLRAMQRVFGSKKPQKLIFDETPYKYYMVKAQSAPSLKYICFNDNNVRIYKGEGTVKLIAYYPYGIATEPVKFENVANNFIMNEGDIDAKLQVFYTAEQFSQLSYLKLLTESGAQVSYLNFSVQSAAIHPGDAYILIDFNTHLIEGLNSQFQKTGRLYNKFVTTGDFFSVPVGKYKLSSSSVMYKVQYTLLYY